MIHLPDLEADLPGIAEVEAGHERWYVRPWDMPQEGYAARKPPAPGVAFPFLAHEAVANHGNVQPYTLGVQFGYRVNEQVEGLPSVQTPNQADGRPLEGPAGYGLCRVETAGIDAVRDHYYFLRRDLRHVHDYFLQGPGYRHEHVRLPVYRQLAPARPPRKGDAAALGLRFEEKRGIRFDNPRDSLTLEVAAEHLVRPEALVGPVAAPPEELPVPPLPTSLGSA